jgi:deazaflavin-dependent oxidoreductase (nitroreductase family)
MSENAKRPGALARLGLAISQLANRRGIYMGRRSTRIHAALYRRTGGRLGARFPGFPEARIALVDHVGARSGAHRTSPLIVIEDGDALVVAASKAGQPTSPAWLHNLIAHPDTTAQVGREVRQVHARVADEAERARLWPQLVAAYSGFELFARDAGRREIPVVILAPR